MSGNINTPTSNAGDGFRFSSMGGSNRTSSTDVGPKLTKVSDHTDNNNSTVKGKDRQRDGGSSELSLPTRCINPSSEVNSRLDTQVEVRVYPCNNSQGSGKKKFTTFTIKPEVRVNSIAIQRILESATCYCRVEIIEGISQRSNPIVANCSLFYCC